jgi:phosphate transport system ATP-binding protein
MPAIHTKDLNLWYGDFQALFDVDIDVKEGKVTSLIGPSGCGKSTYLRAVNRINERLGYVRTTGTIEVMGQNVLAEEVELTQLRREVGMVFQRPNPLPLSIRDNVLFAYRLHRGGKGPKEEEDQVVEEALSEVLLWDKVKDRLQQTATELSLEEQQKLCIARLLPVKPSVLLMDEPCSALDPEATKAVEELIWRLRGDYSILIVTHNMAQARRASDECIFMLMGKVIEHSNTGDMFVTPQKKETADYIEGRYG